MNNSNEFNLKYFGVVVLLAVIVFSVAMTFKQLDSASNTNTITGNIIQNSQYLSSNNQASQSNRLTGFAAYSSAYSGFSDPSSRFIVNVRSIVFENDSDVAYVTFTVKDYFVYEKGYLSLDGQDWVEFTLTPIGESKDGWIKYAGTSTIAMNKDALRLSEFKTETSENYAIVYTCSVADKSWDCHGGWQIIDFTAQLKKKIPPVTNTTNNTNNNSGSPNITIIDLDSDSYNSTADCNDNNANINPGKAEVCGNGVDDDCSGGDSTCSPPPVTLSKVDLCDVSSVIVTSCYSHFTNLNGLVDGNTNSYDDSFNGCNQSPEWWQFSLTNPKALTRVKFLEKNFFDGWIASSPLYYIEYQDTNGVWKNVSAIARNPQTVSGTFNGGLWNEVSFTASTMKAFRLRLYSGGSATFTGLSEVECYSDLPASCSDGITNSGETGVDCGGQCAECVVYIDADSDGRNTLNDCNDNDATKWQFISGYSDSDNDGYTTGSVQQLCSGSNIPNGYKSTTLGNDCLDTNSNVNPSKAEVCGNGLDDNCDGTDSVCPGVIIDVDLDGRNSTVDCNDNDPNKWQFLSGYLDFDSDGYTIGSATQLCTGATLPSTYKSSSLGTDCNDNDVSKWQLLLGYLDSDSDGYTTGISQQICSGSSLPSGYKSSSLGIDCNDNNIAVWTNVTAFIDSDSDGYTVGASTIMCSGASLPNGYRSSSLGADCNDNNVALWALRSGYTDVDHDGYTIGSSQQLCSGATLPNGYNATNLGADCNDNNALQWNLLTGFTDVDSDGYTIGSSQQLCSGSSLSVGYKPTSLGSDCDDSSSSKWQLLSGYNDSDNDGYTTGGSVQFCTGATLPTGYKSTSLGSDCNATNSLKWQLISGYVDNDADGATVGSSLQLCSGISLQTGYSQTTSGTDCNDANSGIRPGAIDICGDSIDQDCSGTDLSCVISDFDSDGVNSSYDCDDGNSSKWQLLFGFTDIDNDGYVNGSSVQICSGASLPVGYRLTSLGADCLDTNALKYQILSVYNDSDADTYTVGSVTQVCTGALPPTGFRITSSGTDCNDNNNAVWTLRSGYVDSDSDGYTIGSIVQLCSGVNLPTGYNASSLGTDCNDASSLVWIFRTGYVDSDSDGYTVGSSVQLCSGASLPSGYKSSSLGTDCNDNNGAVWTNIAAFIDSDSDGYTVGSSALMCSGASLPAGFRSTSLGTDCNDNNIAVWTLLTGFIDSDSDGYTVGSSQQVCSGSALPSGYKLSSLGSDCDDSSSAKWQLLVGYIDSDLDTYSTSSSSQLCTGSSLPSGYRLSLSSPIDCNDANSGIRPGATEICGNGIDENCDGVEQTCVMIIDTDGDGYNSTVDCNDNNNAVWTLRTGYTDSDNDGYTIGSSQQVCSGATLPSGYKSTSLGTDCDDSSSAKWQLLVGYVDSDLDGFSTSASVQTCSGSTVPSGYKSTVSSPVDCVDTNANINPTRVEVCGNGLDDDCIGGDLSCTTPTCSDGLRNGDEIGVDCGGSCAKTCTSLLTSGKKGTQYLFNYSVSYGHKTGGISGYILYLPPNYTSSTKYPVMIFLHGAGEKVCGPFDYTLLRNTGIPSLLNSGKDLPFIVIMPQISCVGDWNGLSLSEVVTVLDRTIANYSVDTTRIYVTGLSLGGGGTNSFVEGYPMIPAAAVPIAGWGSVTCSATANIPRWSFHNEGDGTVASSGSKNVYAALKKCAGVVDPRLSIYATSGHDSWSKTYNLGGMNNAMQAGTGSINYTEEIYSWFMRYSRPELAGTTCFACIGDYDRDGVTSDKDCDEGDPTAWRYLSGYYDYDGDGYTIGSVGQVCSGNTLPTRYYASPSAILDCNMLDAAISPGAKEICGNTVDENCDGIKATCGTGTDADFDGYNTTLDCNDNNANVNPGKTEICGNGLDDDCSGGDATCTGTGTGSSTNDLCTSSVVVSACYSHLGNLQGLVDDNIGTYDDSYNGCASSPEWWQFTFPSSTTINRVNFLEKNYFDGWIASNPLYYIEYLNSNNQWTAVSNINRVPGNVPGSNTGGSWNNVTFDPVTTNSFRLMLYSAGSATFTGLSEVKCYSG